MKIHSIRLKNLNSLQGAHSVEFNTGPLANAGLFAITGPTGAGKSTLLDAITLALYGRAARYGNDPNPGDVMSRHCGECSAEVVFEVPKGVFRAAWERRRARNKPDGALQPPKRYLYDSAGQVLAEKIGDAEAQIEALVGLDYDRFLRSALLAQGEFSKFLKAKADERAALLESLTGTGIYSSLGALAYSTATRMEAELKAQEDRLQQVPVLPDAEREALAQSMESGKAELQKLEAEMESAARMLEKVAQLQTSRGAAEKARAALQAIEAERTNAKDGLGRLELHLRTVPFGESLGRLASAEAALDAASKNQDAAEAELREALEALEKANLALRAALAEALGESVRKAAEANAAAAKLKQTAATTEEWLKQNQKDAGLADQVGDLAAAIGNLKNSRAAFARAWSDWKSGAAEILPSKPPEAPEPSGEAALAAQIDSFLSDAKAARPALEQNLGLAKAQLALRKDHLQKAQLLASLADHRHALESGEPCPLCGALEHPYAEGAVPTVGMPALERELEAAGKNFSAAQRALGDFAKAVSKLESDRGKPLAALRELEKTADELGGKLHPFSATLPAPGAEDGLRQELQNRGKLYRGQSEKLRETAASMQEEARKAAGAEKETAELNAKTENLPPLPQKQATVFPGKVPSVADAAKVFSGAVNHENAARKQSEARSQDKAKAAHDLSGTRERLEKAAAASEFGCLAKLKSAMLPAEEAGRLERIERDLGERTAAAKALLEKALKETSELIAESVPEGEEAKKFQDAQAARRQTRDQLLQDQAKRASQLEADTKNRNFREGMDRELGRGRKALAVWQKLRELIGSHDGAKFRKYAQSISLDILTRHANRHLARLSGRYLIRRDAGETLNLEIEDLDQAGARRPMASLSGGEGFLASLALALGLSDLAGRSVRIDSLFVDEGFGTLDPEALETAIAALETLRQDHKTVGIISHVGLLKERISTQIAVEKQPGGTARIRVVS
jgi:exonuclease SbcC